MHYMDSILMFIKSVRIQDILDIVIIAVLIFALLTWFKTRASRFVLIGITFLGAIYIAARFFQLYLTTIVLQSFFAILLFVLVVIFQEDLRGFFEKLAMLGNIRKKFQPVSVWEGAVKIIAQTVVNLAKQNIGALIVLQGDDPLDRHISGGTSLDGIVSSSLLESIFDPHSAGHDGAVIINRDRITKFGCHLPLFIHTAKYGNLGLRHTAALGMAERSDALCIVVSEEKGTIFLANEEKLTLVDNASVLHEELEKFYVRNAPVKRSSPYITWLKENTLEKVMAIALACTLWGAFGYQRDILRRDFMVPVDYKNAPVNWKIEEPQVAEVKIILQGPAQAFRLLDESSLKLSLDISGIAERKREFMLNKDMLNIPFNLSVAEIVPSKIRVYSSKLLLYSLPVNFSVRNSLSANLYLQKVTLNPSIVKVLIDSHVIRPDQVKIEMEPIDLQQISSTTSVYKKLILPSGVSFPENKSPYAFVTIKVKKKTLPWR
jgi:diadenylate cyclase